MEYEHHGNFEDLQHTSRGGLPDTVNFTVRGK